MENFKSIMDSFRKLATIRKIKDISSIPDADTICTYHIDGWKVVDKIDKYVIDQLVVFIEVDSWVPTALAPFLSKGKEPKEYNGIKGERLRTVKLKKQISQGLILPVTSLSFTQDGVEYKSLADEGDDVTDILGIQKWEPPVSYGSGGGQPKGNWPSFLRKTDQERVQNINLDKIADHTFFVTEKLDGSSMTVYVNYVGTPEEVTGVTSKNVDLKEDDTNKWWIVAKKYNLIEKLKSLNRNVALQGELVGPDTCGNKYNLKELKFYAFNIFDIDKQENLLPSERISILSKVFVDVPWAPLEDDNASIEGLSTDELLINADRTSLINANVLQEGFVYSSNKDPEVSFKIVSNSWLLKYKE